MTSATPTSSPSSSSNPSSVSVPPSTALDPSTITDVRTLVRLRDDYLLEIEIARETIAAAESKLSLVTTQLSKIAAEAQALLATIGAKPPSRPSSRTASSGVRTSLIGIARELTPAHPYPTVYFANRLPSVNRSTISHHLQSLVDSKILTQLESGIFTRGPAVS